MSIFPGLAVGLRVVYPAARQMPCQAYHDISTYAKIDHLLFLHILIYLDTIM